MLLSLISGLRSKRRIDRHYLKLNQMAVLWQSGERSGVGEIILVVRYQDFMPLGSRHFGVVFGVEQGVM